MANLNLFGAELGTTLDTIAIAGGGSLPTSGGGVPRTGTYAYRCNTAGSAKWSAFGVIDGNGRPADMARTAATYYTVMLKFTSLPNTNMDVLSVRNSAGSSVVAVHVSSGGVVTLVGTSTSGTVATLSTGTWYRVQLRVTSNSTAGLSIDGGAEVTVTANNVTQDRLILGTVGSVTMDAYYDDVMIDDAAFLGIPAIKIAVPIGAGTAGSGWDTGTSNLFSAVDEIPHNTTDYIASTGVGDTSKIRRFTVQSSATVGLSNTIVNVQVIGIMRESSSASTTGTVGLRSSSSEVTGTMTDIGDTNYLGFFLNNLLDPNGSIAWTTSGFDGIQVGAHKGTDDSGIRCTALYAMVLTVQSVVSGSAAATFPSLSAAASGYMQPNGEGAPSLPGLTASASGTHVGDASGTAAPTLPSLSASATGTQAQTGTASPTLPSLSAAASGSHTQSGTGAPTLPSLTASASGTSALAGTGAPTLPGLAATASGTHTPQDATGAATLPGLTAAASATVAQTGEAAASFPGLAVVAVGLMVPVGAGAMTLPGLTAAAIGTHGEATGVGAITLPGLVAVAVGLMVPSGAGAATLPSLSASASGTAQQTGAGAAVLPSLAAAATGTQETPGTGAATLPGLTALADGYLQPVGTGAMTLPALVAAAVGELMGPAADGAMTFPFLAAVAIGRQGASVYLDLPAGWRAVVGLDAEWWHVLELAAGSRPVVGLDAEWWPVVGLPARSPQVVELDAEWSS